jgi:hypothetical protein
MRTRRTVRAGLAAVLLAAGPAVIVAPASANSEATVSYGTFSCSDGRTVEFFGMPAPRFPELVGFLEGRGVVAQWVANDADGTLTVLNGVHQGQSIALDTLNLDFGPAPLPGRSHRPVPASATDLDDKFTSCTRTDHLDPSPTTLTQEDLDQLGLDSSYLGAVVTVDGSANTTVWISRMQLSQR